MECNVPNARQLCLSKTAAQLPGKKFIARDYVILLYVVRVCVCVYVCMCVCVCQVATIPTALPS